MGIETYIQQEVLAKRLKDFEVLVVYDPEQRYHSTCLAMSGDRRQVVDATESSIESREASMRALQALGRRELDGLLIYVPAPQPLEETAKQRDPFAIYAACGAVFPDRTRDGDDFQSLCLQAKPEHGDELRDLFERDPQPTFAVVDKVGGGLHWPNLRAQLDVESSRDILLSLLAPSKRQEEDLKRNDAWVDEARELLQTCIGLNLRTRGKSWSTIADELWRFVLFSEFAFDLPVALPVALADIPLAPDRARAVIEGLCDTLRNDQRTQARYIERAEQVERELQLPEHCRDLSDLGDRDTFAFEERTFLRQAMAAFSAGDLEAVRARLSRHEHSVWAARGENRLHWQLVEAATELADHCAELQSALGQQPDGLDELVGSYVRSLHEADRLHREFEQSVSDLEWQDLEGVIAPIRDEARKRYAGLVEQLQQRFSRCLQAAGWPATGYLFNAQVFDEVVAPKLQQNGHRVAYFMVDALRYELGVALEKQLADDAAVELTPALAQLPSITLVGMASLLPGAGEHLRLERTDRGLKPVVGDMPVTSVPQRMELFRRRYGQRFDEVRLEEFVRGKSTGIADHVDLLVVRSVEIDSQFENHPETAPTEIANSLKRIRMAIHRLREQGFKEVVIATDHGFCMNTHAGAGDVIDKPEGDWVTVHDRCALGDGAAGDDHIVTDAEKVGVRGEFSRFAAPRSLAAYRAGLAYYHGGASLQECVVPVITMQLRGEAQPTASRPSVSLDYKHGSRRITTRVPVIDISIERDDMFSVDATYELLIEAQDKKGNVVGEAKVGGAVNAATGTVSLQPGDRERVTLKMSPEFEGKFKIKALDPRTNTNHAQLDLETDYAV
ncbi:PglZ domain-containing protein [Halorhodospira halochloris]|uniref:PglZ domain-containing protein n=1 Tax=Halorhodospira halochloris TaxID=1052 RepID=UPI001EE87E46|nr:PglZ domain-containing protein [Halorhodospira halochloris]MCG5549215.1 PglZ domain-containing protein [Halorhodospira halochloris]